MESKREQALVGLFVVIAAGLLIYTVFSTTAAVCPTAKTYHAHFPFAGGLEPGAIVRYSGGPKIGRVEQLRVSPEDPGQIDVTFSVKSDLPVKTDSKVKIMSMSPLGDNHLELLPGTAQASIAPEGSLIASEKYIDFNALTDQIDNIAPQAQQLLTNLN